MAIHIVQIENDDQKLGIDSSILQFLFWLKAERASSIQLK